MTTLAAHVAAALAARGWRVEGGRWRHLAGDELVAGILRGLTREAPAWVEFGSGGATVDVRFQKDRLVYRWRGHLGARSQQDGRDGRPSTLGR